MGSRNELDSGNERAKGGPKAPAASARLNHSTIKLQQTFPLGIILSLALPTRNGQINELTFNL